MLDLGSAAQNSGALVLITMSFVSQAVLGETGGLLPVPCTQGHWKPPAVIVPWLIPRLERVCTQLAASHHNPALVSQENI